MKSLGVLFSLVVCGFSYSQEGKHWAEGATFLPHRKAIIDIIITPKNEVLTASEDGLINLWDMKSEQLKAVVEFGGPLKKVGVFKGDGSFLGISPDGTLRAWQKGKWTTYQEKLASFDSFRMLSDNRCCLLIEDEQDNNGKLVFLTLTDKGFVKHNQIAVDWPILDVDSRRNLLFVRCLKKLHVFPGEIEVKAVKPVFVFEEKEYINDFDERRGQLLIGTTGKVVKLFDLKTGKDVSDFKVPGQVYTCKFFGDDGNVSGISFRDNSFFSFNKALTEYRLKVSPNRMACLGSASVLVCSEKEAMVFSFADGNIFSRKFSHEITACCCSSDGAFFFIGLSNGLVRCFKMVQ